MIDILATMTPDEYRYMIATLVIEGHEYHVNRTPAQEAEDTAHAEEILHTLRGTESSQR